MSIRNNYKHTIFACEIGYVTQAIVNNFIPLLFLTFQKNFEISLDQIALLITFNFGVQLIVDALSVGFIKKAGYRSAMIFAHLCAALGLVCLAVLPGVLPNAYIGILISIILYAIGGGLLEVMVSPIVEACPSDDKEGVMSILHSFYCWGHIGVVVVSTLFFYIAGIDCWPVMACLWAVVPLINSIYFKYVPIYDIVPEGRGMSFMALAKTKMFWILILMMICSGASEQGMSQWASAFAEEGLGISKTAGDLLGPCMFALTMGIARWLYGKYSEKMPLKKTMILCSGLCIFSYRLAGAAATPWLGLAGCILCGFSVGIMWPGTFSIGAASFRNGGTVLFAMLALAGDIGCAAGPAAVGFVADAAGQSLKSGLGFGILFPCVLILMTVLQLYETKKGGCSND